MSSPADETRTTRPTITPTRGGTALAVVGAVLLGLGIFTSTGASVQPSCPAGTRLVAKFVYKESGYRFDSPSGNSGVVSLSATSATGGKFTSKEAIASVVVKGGPGSKDTWITPASTSGTFSNAGLPPVSGRTPNIDNVQFCAATAVNPAAAAAGFDVVTSGDAVLAANESEGPVAVGGNLSFDQYQVAIHSAGSFKIDPSDAQPTSLVVRGKFLTGSSKGQLSANKGWVTVGNPAGVAAKRSNPNQIVVNATSAKADTTPRILGQNSAQSISSATRKSTYDFDGTFAGWKKLAGGLSRCDATFKLAGANGPTAPWSGGDGYLYPSGSGQMILKLKADDLAKLTSITFRPGAEPSASRPLVINVAGVPKNWNPPNVNGDANGFAPYILWNFGEATSVTITGGNQLVGTAFAPYGTVDQEGRGNLVGAVYAAKFIHNGGAEVHDRAFATTVTPCSCTPPTTTTSTTTSSTTTTVYPTSTQAPTTTASTTTTVYPTSTEAPTSTEYPTTTVYPTSTEAPSSTVYPTSTEPTTTGPEATTTTAEVAGTTVVATSITPDDNTRVESATTSGGSGLAFTGSTSFPLVLIGGLMLLAGLTTVLVSRRRSRTGTTTHGAG